jgi:hypothetical protein
VNEMIEALLLTSLFACEDLGEFTTGKAFDQSSNQLTNQALSQFFARFAIN